MWSGCRVNGFFKKDRPSQKFSRSTRRKFDSCHQMSRVVELAVLFVAGAITGGAFMYSTRKETPPPTPQSPSPPAVPTQLLRRDVALGEPMSEGCRLLMCD